MSNIIFYGAISLDGYLADKNHGLQWLFDTNVGNGTTYAAFIETIGTTVMGRRTYEELWQYTAGEDPYKNQKNYVFSHQHFAAQPGYTVVNQSPVSFLQELKKTSTQDIWVVGGGQLLVPLLEADMIDEWYIQLAPVLLGEGQRLFQTGKYQRRLEFLGQTQFGEFSEVHYRKLETL